MKSTMKQIAKNGTVYELTGPEGAPVIALIHGLGLHRAIWKDYLPVLEQDYRVLNYDLFGHGESPAPPEVPTLTTFSEQLHSLMNECGINQAALAGFSLGGMINRRFAMDHPDGVSSLLILNSPHERGDEAQRLVEERAAKSDSGGPGATLNATIERWFTAEFRANNDDYIQQVRSWVLANELEAYAQCRWVLAAGVVELIRPQPPITHPTLVITCENDSGSTPAMTDSIASEITGARAFIIPTLQHMGLVERPNLFLKPMLDFLAE